MTRETQAVLLDAAPLLTLAALYLVVAAALAPELRRGRGDRAFALALAYPLVGLAALVAGVGVLAAREPLAVPGLTLALAVLAAVPAVAALLAPRGREPAAAAAVPSFGTAADSAEIAALLVDGAAEACDLDTVALALVDWETRTARFLYARDREGRAPWIEAVPVDLDGEPSGVATAALSAEPLAVFDAASSAQVNRELVERSGMRSAAFLPLRSGDRVLGVLVAATSRPRALEGDELAALGPLLAEAARALERTESARVLEHALGRERRQLREQAALLEAARALTSEIRFEAVIERLVDQLSSLLDADAADCWLFDASGQQLVCRAVLGLPESEVGRRIPPAGTVGEAIATGRPVLCRDFARTEQPPPSASFAQFAEVMDAPILSRGDVRGVLGVCSREHGRFDESHLRLLEAFAGLASIALQNAEAFEESARQAQVQSGFAQIAAVLGEPLSAEATRAAVAQAAAEALGGEGAVFLRTVGAGLEVAGATPLPKPLGRALARGVASDALQAAAAEGRTLASTALAEDERFASSLRSGAASAGLTALLAVPVDEGRDRPRALVVVFFSGTHHFADADLTLADQVASAASAALERSELYEAERRSRGLAQGLARATRALAAELDPGAVLDELVEHAPGVLGAGAASVRLLEGDELAVAAAWGAGAEAALDTRLASTAWLVGDIVQSRAPLALADARADDRALESDPMFGGGHRAYLGVPLVAPDDSLQGILAVYDRKPRDWRQEEIETLLALSGAASAALANAQVYQSVALDRERSVAILANIADGIVAVDRDGCVVLWNRAAEEITGVPAAEAVGRRPTDAIGRELTSDDGPLVPIRRGADEAWLSVTEAVMTDPTGAVAGRIFAFRDISDERVVEQMKSDFVSTVSHELRRPLTSIYGFAETLLRQDVLFGDEERRTFLSYISSESERLTTIVDTLLSVAQLDTGDMHVQLGRTDVGEVVEEAVRNVEETVGTNGHDFVVELAPGPLAAEADRDKLRQVLQSLLDNAVRYSPYGGKVTVAARRTRDAVEVRVEDEGIGIPASERERIFRKFYRAESAQRAGASGGTGLGLFIAEGLVTAMHGRIWVDSEEGRGSTFVFELPVAESES